MTSIDVEFQYLNRNGIVTPQEIVTAVQEGDIIAILLTDSPKLTFP